MKYMIKVILVFVLAGALFACSQNDVPGYEDGRALYFERFKVISPVKSERIDTAYYSFSNYVGKDELTHYFKLGLIGNLLEKDLEYVITVVDSLTTATPEQYTLPEHPIFHAGGSVDSLPIMMHKVASLKDKEVVLTVRLQENVNFGLGYAGYRDVKIRFNDRVVQPTWWDDEVERAYLGVWSLEKLETVIAANPGFTTFEGLSATAKRKVALNTKQYIADNGITEKNGDPMEIPMY